jgi:nucleoside-diphosphate-sugar epimerase
MEKGVPGESYILAGEACTYVDAFQLASHISGKPAPPAVSSTLFKILSVLVRPFDRFLPEMYSSERMRVLAGVTYWADNSKARRFLGYKPRPLSEGLESTLRHEMSLLGM